MGSLGQLGVTGLIAVNSWMSTISSNINGTSRTAYKPTRVSLLDGPVNLQGSFQIPQPTLQVQATSLEWAQGSIRQSESSAHFALQGQGFFVLADDAGKYYLTRDGEFHWDGLGYLRNSNGLRVLSNGQDFVRKGSHDLSDGFNVDGESLDLARYGDKSLLVVDVANRDGLKFSQYGSTVFEVDGELPLRVENDFDTSIDGLTFIYRDPKQLPYVGNHDTPLFITTPGATDFSIDLGENGSFNFVDNFPPPGGGTPFDPNTHTIQDVLDAINSYGTVNNANITASYDPGTDRLLIRNIAEPKTPDPDFRVGNFSIDFGDNGVFLFRSFDPASVTIQGVVDEINRYATINGLNIVASFNAGTKQFSLTNTTGAIGNNEIRFSGANGSAIADFFDIPEVSVSTGGGGQNILSVTNIDNNPPSTNTFAEILPADIAGTPLSRLVEPDTPISFREPNGIALAKFFQVYSISTQEDAASGFSGSRLQSQQDIDNSDVLDSDVVGEHSLDIEIADVNTKSFSEYVNTTDSSVPTVDPSGPPALYNHDKVNNVVVSDGTANQGRGLIGISHAQQTEAFDLVMDFSTTSSVLELHFGQQRNDQIDSGGYTLQYDPASGQIDLLLRSKTPNDPPVVISSVPGVLPITGGVAGPHRLAARLSKDGLLELSINGATTSFQIVPDERGISGYLTLGHYEGRLELFNMYADFKAYYNHDATGSLVSKGVKSYASIDVSAPASSRGSTRVLQSSLESSNASLTEYLPMLGLAQKVFTSLSKIINVSNAIQDDLNQLIR